MSVIYYHTQWSTYGRNFQIANLPTNTPEIAYAFYGLHRDSKTGLYVVGVDEPSNQPDARTPDAWADYQMPFDGTKKSLAPLDTAYPSGTWEEPKGNLGQLKKLKANGYITKTTLSVGGWTYSKNFSKAVATAADRASVAASVVGIFQVHTFFEGINFDYEYPSNLGVNLGEPSNVSAVNDADNFVLLLLEMRRAFAAAGIVSKISVATVAAPEKLEGHVKLRELANAVDELHIMTYDFQDGSWGLTKSGHHCNLFHSGDITAYSADEAVRYFLSKGVPSRKLYIGVAFYSRGFGKTSPPLGNASTGGGSEKSWEDGILDYSDIVSRIESGQYTEEFDAAMQAPYAYSSNGDIITYDNVESVKAKLDYVAAKNLGGIIVWETSGDVPYSHPKSLMKVLNEYKGKPPVEIPPPVPVVVPPPVQPPVVVPPPVKPPPYVPPPPVVPPPVIPPPPVPVVIPPPVVPPVVPPPAPSDTIINITNLQTTAAFGIGGAGIIMLVLGIIIGS